MAFASFLLAVGWFYQWRPASFHVHWLNAKPEGFYNELCDAFLAGQVSLKRQPDPRLMALPDPYDPSQNAAYRVNDLSYFNGRYYVYMGPAPVLTVFMPVRLLTGRYLNQESAATLLNLLGAAASVALLFGLRRHFLPAAPASILVIAAFALALADGYYVADRGAIAQQVAIANAYAFAMLALWACGKAVTSRGNPQGWLAAASLCLGVAVASRPNYVFASAALLPPLLYLRSVQRFRRPADFWAAAAAAAVPLGVVVSLLLTYDRIRFGHLFDFGQRYQLGSWNQIKLSASGLGHGWENAWRYLLAPALYSAYFPFVAAPTWIAVSVLRHVPWLWLAPIAGWALFRRGAPGPVRMVAISALILAATNLLTLIFLPSGNPAAVLTSANARYLLDFQPGLTLFVALGVIVACQASVLGTNFRKWVVVSLAACLALASIVIALSLDIGSFPSESYRPLAYAMDLPAYALELVRGDSFGALSVDLSFPTGKSGSFEPVVSTGTADANDLLYANYVSPTEIRFGLVSTDARGPLSDPVKITYGTPHHLQVSMGSLYPPIGHPRWSALGDPQIEFLRRNLHVVLDGRTVLDSPAHFHPASPDQVRLGQNAFLGGYSSSSFSGRILSSRRLPIMAPPASTFREAAYGTVRMSLLLPSRRDVGAREPLLGAGVSRAGDIVYVQYLPGDQIRLGVDHWGSRGVETGPLRVAFDAKHTVEITMGSLFPTAVHGPQTQHLRILFDGAAVLDAEQDSYDSSPYDVTIGTNAIGGSTCSYAFTGRILGVERIPAPQ